MLESIGDVMREAYKRNWITIRDGNCAFVNTAGKTIHMTPSGVRKNIIFPESLVRITYKENKVTFHTNSSASPSGEWDMHYRVLRAAKADTSTLHLHPPCIVAAMHAGWELIDLVTPFPEVYRYTKVGKNVEAHQALSKELAEDTLNNLSLGGKLYFDIVGQKSHGVCARGEDPWEAFEHIERVEHICKIVLLSGVKPPVKKDLVSLLERAYLKKEELRRVLWPQ